MIYPRQQPWRGPHADWNVVEKRLSQRLLHALQIGLEQVRPKHAYLTASRLAAAQLNASLKYFFKIRLHETFCENCRYLCTCTSCMRQSAQLTACFAIGCSITSNPFRNAFSKNAQPAAARLTARLAAQEGSSHGADPAVYVETNPTRRHDSRPIRPDRICITSRIFTTLRENCVLALKLKKISNCFEILRSG